MLVSVSGTKTYMPDVTAIVDGTHVPCRAIHARENNTDGTYDGKHRCHAWKWESLG